MKMTTLRKRYHEYIANDKLPKSLHCNLEYVSIHEVINDSARLPTIGGTTHRMVKLFNEGGMSLTSLIRYSLDRQNKKIMRLLYKRYRIQFMQTAIEYKLYHAHKLYDPFVLMDGYKHARNLHKPPLS